MNSKFKEMFEARVKDYGLSDKALGELEERSVSLIGDDESDEAKLTTQVDFLDGIAKAMQGEVTRKVQAAKKDTQTALPPTDGGKPKDEPRPSPKDDTGDPVMAQLKALQEAVRTLTEANAKSERERRLRTREEMVREAAKKAQLDQKLIQFVDTSEQGHDTLTLDAEITGESLYLTNVAPNMVVADESVNDGKAAVTLTLAYEALILYKALPTLPVKAAWNLGLLLSNNPSVKFITQ